MGVSIHFIGTPFSIYCGSRGLKPTKCLHLLLASLYSLKKCNERLKPITGLSKEKESSYQFFYIANVCYIPSEGYVLILLLRLFRGG